jgi:hypothetical protein
VKGTVRERPGSHYKTDESSYKSIEKWFPGMLSEALRTSGKVCHCPKEAFSGKYCVNRCKITSFCAKIQFRELFEANISAFW